MLKRLKNIIAGIALAVVIVLTPAAAVTALSAPSNLMARSALAEQACLGLNSIDASEDCNNQAGDGGVSKLVTSIITILSYIVGIIAVIFLIVAGFKYITAGGDSNKISSAKSTLIYALIGVAIVAAAQFLVNIVYEASTTL